MRSEKCQQAAVGQLLFDHLVGKSEHHEWNGKPKRRSSLKVEDERELRWPQNSQLGRIGAYLAGVVTSLSVPVW